MTEELKTKTEEAINRILKEGIATTNLEHLYKLTKINHIAKEDENMNYGNEYGRGNYGNYNGNYGNYGNEYGRRGYDAKYRGNEHLDRMYGEYGRYMENREKYGASEDTDRSFHYMVKALEDFVKVLYEEANTQQQKQMLKETLQRSMM